MLPGDAALSTRPLPPRFHPVHPVILSKGFGPELAPAANPFIELANFLHKRLSINSLAFAMLHHTRLWKIGLGIALGEFTLVLGLLLALAVANGGLAITIGAPEPGGAEGLRLPVAGVRPEDLKDSWGDRRSGGRAHKGIDIFAPDGTPVLAPADAVVVERRVHPLGGITLYLRDTDGVTVYYYAHLRGYRAGLKEGYLVRRGDVVGYVGRTGNVQGSSHLHFGVSTVRDPNRWGAGRDRNPYPLLAR